MFRKEKLLFFAVLGLGCVYGVLWLLVHLTRNRSAGLIRKKLTVGMLIIFFSSFIGSGMAFGQTKEEPPGVFIALYGVPAPTTSPTPLYGIPSMASIQPSNTVVPVNTEFTVSVNFSTITDEIASYGLDVLYDEYMLTILDVKKGDDGLITIANLNNPGIITVGGFDTMGIGPNNGMEFLQLDFRSAGTPGITKLDLNIDTVTTRDNRSLYTSTYGGTVTIEDIMLGDVDGNQDVNIVDALKIAQYVVGLNPPNFNPEVADVNSDGKITIVDALMVAQKYIGLLDEFPQG